MKGICFMLACLLAFSVSVYGQEALTIDDVINMVKAKLRSRTIVQKINLSSMQYVPSVDDIVRLKKAGASRRVVDAVLAAPVTGPPEVPAAAAAPSPEPWTSPAPMASSRPEPASPEPTSTPLERGAYSHFEVFGGYSYFRADDSVSGSYNMHGWNSSFVQNINHWIGIVADVSGHYGTPSAPLLDTQRNHTFLFGPQFAMRSHARVVPYAHGMFGFSHVNVGLAGVFTSDIGLAYGFGGGVDIKLSDSLSVRAGQMDYINIRLAGVGTHNLRVSTGLVAGW